MRGRMGVGVLMVVGAMAILLGAPSLALAEKGDAGRSVSARVARALAPVAAMSLGSGDRGDGDGDDGERAGKHKPQLHGVVNLNTADEAMLELLPQIGPTKAAKIASFRQKHPFKKIEDVTHVKGIGRKTFARLKPFLSVTGPSTLAEDGPPAL